MTAASPIEVSGVVVTDLAAPSLDVPRWAMLSGSGLPRADVCPASCALPTAPAVLEVEQEGDDDEDGTEDDDDGANESRDATRGTAIHAFMERLSAGMERSAALALCPVDVAETCEGIDTTAIPAGRPEVAFAFNVLTGAAREITRTTHRAYGELHPAEIPCTLDLIVPAENNRGVPLVVDWKTGFEPVTPARQNLQLALGALCVRATTGAPVVAVAIGKIEPDGRLKTDVAVLDELELDAAQTDVRRVWSAVQAARESVTGGQVPTVQESQHCKWCPAKPSCPAYATEVATLAKLEDGWMEGVRRQLADPEAAAYWWQRTEKAEHVLKAIRKALRERAQREPIPLQGGFEVRSVEVVRKRVDGKAALKVLTAALGEDTARSIAEVKVTQKSIQTTCGPEAKEVLQLLKDAGAMTEFETRQVRRVRAKKEAQ